MHFFQNPLGPTGKPADPRLAPAQAAFKQVTSRLKEVTSGSTYVYLVELKKLCVAILGTDERARARKRTALASSAPVPPTPAGELRAELVFQLQSFALVGKLTPEQVQQAAARADERARRLPTESRAGFMVEELRQMVGASADRPLAEGLERQPMQWILTGRPELLEALEPHVEVLSDHVFQVLDHTRTALVQLTRAQGPPGAPS